MIAAHYGKVEQKHIDNGIRMHTYKCPIALAIREKFESSGCGIVQIDVDSEDIFVWFDNGETRQHYETPIEAQLFLEDFDNGDEVEPFDFVAYPKEYGMES